MPYKEQDDTRTQRHATHGTIQNDRVRPRYVDFDEPKIRGALRGEVREARNRQGDSAQDYRNQPDHYERSHPQPPISVELPACRTR